MSLAEKLAALTNPEPVFADPESDQDLTTAKVVEGEVEGDSDYLAVGSSSLRTKNADLAFGSRYAGKKVSRAAVDRARGAQQQEDGGDDFKEHAAADLGHMFKFDDEAGDSAAEEDSDAADGDTDNESGEEEEGEGEEDSEAEDDNEDDVDDQVNDMEQTGNKSGPPPTEENRFVFDKNDTDFSQFAGIEDDNSDDNDDNSDDDSEVENEVENGDDNDSNAESGEGEEDSKDLNGKRLRESVQEEVQKGEAVAGQLKVWDKLLETRIQQQKILIKTNKLPVTAYWNKLNNPVDTELQNSLKTAQKELKLLIFNQMQMESVMRSRDVESEEPEPKRMKLNELADSLSSSHQACQSEHNTLIQKWNDKTRISSGKNSFASMETSTLSQIDQIMSNVSRLVERTRLKRSNYRSMGRQETVAEDNQVMESDVDIFDDDDFYHQLLRDLIDKKTNSSADQSQLTRQWLEVQKLRTKLKKKVDTKASKGRKVRYDIHAKLVNFMAPLYDRSEREVCNTELYASLFGSTN